MKPVKSLIVGLMAISSLAFAAEVTITYKWVDENGQIKYGDRPPVGVKYERIKIRKDTRAGGPQAKAGEKFAAGTAAKDPNAAVREQLKQAEEQLNQRCKIARANLDTLNNSRLISIPDGEGGKRLLTEEEIAQKRKETEEQVQRYCEEQGSNGPQ